MAKFNAMVRHYGESAQTLTEKPFRTKEAAEKYCREQYEIAKGYNKSFGLVNGVYTIFSSDGQGFAATVYFVQKI